MAGYCTTPASRQAVPLKTSADCSVRKPPTTLADGRYAGQIGGQVRRAGLDGGGPGGRLSCSLGAAGTWSGRSDSS
jgi:hypothetical protein